jgi:4-oxalocrotonate tautomerase
MPIITIQVIKGVVLTSPEQKRELLKKMTDTFISVVGDVARPYTYCIIQETPVMEWSIAGTPLPDLPFLYGPEYAAMHKTSNGSMRKFVESQTNNPPAQASAGASSARGESRKRAQKAWEGG